MVIVVFRGSLCRKQTDWKRSPGSVVWRVVVWCGGWWCGVESGGVMWWVVV